MTKTLYVPDHVAAEENEKRQATVASAYVEKEEKVLDPTRLDLSLNERLPQPTGWRILVMPYSGRKTSDGGIHIPDSVRDREALATVVAYVLKCGPLCYSDKDKFGDTPWAKEKQWVLIGRYAGARFKLGDNAECRIINDDEVIATIDDPDDIVSV